MLWILIATSRHTESHKRYVGYKVCTLPSSTCDTAVLISAAKKSLRMIYKAGFLYKKSGEMALETIPLQLTPITLFEDSAMTQKRIRLMDTIDTINARYGKEKVKFASEGIEKDWQTRCAQRSPQFMSSLDTLPHVK